MDKTNVKYSAYVQILTEELVPAMGCTEPIAIAYAAAKSREVLGGLPDHVLVEASGNLIKNVKSVVVPNTGGLRGIEAAAAAGIVAGKADLLLEVISQVTKDEQSAIEAYMERDVIQVEFLDSEQVFDLRVTMKRNTDEVKARIVNYHTNLVHLEHNGRVLLDLPVAGDEENNLADRTLLNMKDILDFANTVDIADVKELLDRQIQCNMAISQEGLTHSYGANIGQVIRAASPADDLIAKAKSAAAAGSDARMGGCEMPVIINSGSGNQGMTASVPVIVYAQGTGASQEKLYRALALSNLITIHQKTRIGRLSAYCGAVSAGVGSGAAIAYLVDGSYEAVAHTIINALAIISGTICDGAKPSCAAKIAAAVDAGVLGYHMFRSGQQFRGGEGIVTKGVEETIANIGRLGRFGMRETDREIIRIMTDCRS